MSDENLVFSQKAADDIKANLDAANTTLSSITPAAPGTADFGHPTVTSAVQNLAMGLGVYGTNLLIGTKHCSDQVKAAGDSLNIFDRNLEAIAPVLAETSKKVPVKTEHGDRGYESNFSINAGGFGKSRSSYRGQNSKEHKTQVSPFGTVTDTYSQKHGDDKVESVQHTNIFTGHTTTKNTYENESGTTVHATEQSPLTGTNSQSHSHLDHDGNGVKVSQTDAPGVRVTRVQAQRHVQNGGE